MSPSKTALLRHHLLPPASGSVENLSVPLWDGPVLQADHVVQHVGINLGTSHFYMDDRQATADQVQALGFRYVRTPRVAPGNADMRDLTARLFAKGIRGTCQVDDYGPATVAQRVQEALGVNGGEGYPVGYTKAIRVRNEGNPSDPADWQLATPADSTTSTAGNVSINQAHRETSEAWTAVQGIDPSVTVSLTAPAARGNPAWWARLALKQWAAITNRGDIHGYQAGHTPGQNKELEYAAAYRAEGAAFHQGRIDLTEWGFHNKMDTLSTHKPTPPEVAAYLGPRAFYDLIADDDSDTTRYTDIIAFQLKNEVGENAGTTSDHEAAFGLLEDDGVTEKPFGAAIRRTLALHADPGAAFTPRVPRVQVSGLGPNDTRKLFQRRNGTWVLEMHRRDVTGWDPSAANDTVAFRANWSTGNKTMGYIAMAAAKPVTITMSLPRLITAYAPSLQAAPIHGPSLGFGLTVQLREHPVFIEIGPSLLDILPA